MNNFHRGMLFRQIYLLKKGNYEQLGLGKLRHKGIKINVLILYGMVCG